MSLIPLHPHVFQIKFMDIVEMINFFMRKKLLILFFIILAFTIIYLSKRSNEFLNSQSIGDSEEKIISAEVLISRIDAGRAIYEAKCISCHGEDLKGNKFWNIRKDIDGNNLPPPLNGSGHTWHHSPDQLFNIIKYGLNYFDPNYDGNMRGFNELSDDEIYSTLDFIIFTWPEEIREQYTKKYQ